MKHTIKYLAGSAVSLLLAGSNLSAVTYDTAGALYTEDFDGGLPTGATNVAWTDDSSFSGWSAFLTGTGAAPDEYRITSSGNSSDANVFQWRDSASSSDGALGSRPQTATGAIIFGLELVNETGGSLTEFTLGYTGEQWFESSTLQNNQFIVSYQIGTISDLSSGSWTTIDALTFDSPHESGGDTNLDGSDPANQVVLAPVTVSGITWETGTELWIRWYDANSSGIDQGIAIDDVSFTAVPEPASIGLFIALGGFMIAAGRRNYRKRS
tara:strand:+ start:21248 stop:22051 length:804 start_codon:yes stop_codon:yes gene_type:complete